MNRWKIAAQFLLWLTAVSVTFAACKLGADIETIRAHIDADRNPPYTVTFNANGGSPVPAQTVKKGNKATAPQGLTRSGHTFDDWFTDNETFLYRWNFNTPVTENITLYAQWVKGVVSSIGVELVWVPGGSFDMGKELNPASGYGDVTPVHPVTLSGFLMGETEVTQAQWLAVMGWLPDGLTASGYGVGDKCPVYFVRWYDAVEFCNALSEREGLTPAYTVSGTNVTWNRTATGYRLPTEAEWEYAAKGGNGTPGNYTYAGNNSADEVAWHSGNSSSTQEVGAKKPNGLGLHDMSGNVYEWCWDWYDSYSSEPQSDPEGASSGSGRVGRGGSWYSSAEFVRSADRRSNAPGSLTGSRDFGFRLVRSSEVTANAETPNIIVQPINGAYLLNDPASPLMVQASVSDGGTLSYQWYSNTLNSNSGGTLISGAQAPIYTPPTNAVGTVYYYAVVTNTNNGVNGIRTATVASAAVVVGVIEVPIDVGMVWVPGGSFEMGRNMGTGGGSDTTPVHTVTLTTGFYMGKYEVTQAQYQAVMGTNPSSFTGENLPVETVSWYDAVEFCNVLSEIEGFTPYYTINKTEGSDPNNTNTSDPYRWLVTRNTTATGYRLPTEAQWEYAAKGGNPDAAGWVGYTYAGSDDPNEVAWYGDNSGSTTHAVGTKNPNGLGLYDMSGNVWEWCWDWYESYSSDAQTDPEGASSGSNRV